MGTFFYLISDFENVFCAPEIINIYAYYSNTHDIFLFSFFFVYWLHFHTLTNLLRLKIIALAVYDSCSCLGVRTTIYVQLHCMHALCALLPYTFRWRNIITAFMYIRHNEQRFLFLFNLILYIACKCDFFSLFCLLCLVHIAMQDNLLSVFFLLLFNAKLSSILKQKNWFLRAKNLICFFFKLAKLFFQIVIIKYTM